MSDKETKFKIPVDVPPNFFELVEGLIGFIEEVDKSDSED